ncbi:Txe/YoeB family addiction module toxin [Andreprevotia chitinilytica]|uniref:Txe/YoeB family addiction module toxin n=1 Tax=Andreprevotia chitinilytica TaxID=396808 RepID=UPI00055082FF|nr:Txe/YoeB family addiction module toxin [Andreprevotia chitinilytica]
MDIRFDRNAWEDYLYWQQTDRVILKRINLLIREIQRDPFVGIGKPEPLKHQLSGFWSRRINDEHRLVYAVRDDTVTVLQCRDHY